MILKKKYTKCVDIVRKVNARLRDFTSGNGGGLTQPILCRFSYVSVFFSDNTRRGKVKDNDEDLMRKTLRVKLT